MPIQIKICFIKVERYIHYRLQDTATGGWLGDIEGRCSLEFLLRKETQDSDLSHIHIHTFYIGVVC